MTSYLFLVVFIKDGKTFSEERWTTSNGNVSDALAKLAIDLANWSYNVKSITNIDPNTGK